MSTNLLPEEIQQKLQCGYCSNLLSAGKVTVPDEVGRLYACGRCSGTHGSSVRAAAYEAIASIVKFPCRFSKSGCNRQLAWGSVLDHEKACEHRVYECVAENCKWKGDIDTLKLHVQEVHHDLIKRSFKIPAQVLRQIFFIFEFDELFLVEYNTFDSIFSLNVRYIGKPQDSGRFTYEVNIKQNNSKRVCPLQLYEGKMKAYNDYENYQDKMDLKQEISELEVIMGTKSIRCLIKIAQIIPKKEKKLKEENVNLKISENKIEKPTNSEKIISIPKCKLNEKKTLETKEDKENINADVQSVVVAPSEKSSISKRVDSNIIRELECPVCQEYIVPPIYLCTLGHSICSECKPKLTKCPTCSSEYGNTRNYVLENMLLLINFPCQNECYGCTFTGTITSIQQHKNSCKYNNIDCPIPTDCQWKGPLDQLTMHLKSYHKRNVYVKLNELITYNLNNDETSYNLVNLENMIFRISCTYVKKRNGLIKWSFQQIVPKTFKNYKIEIEFIDQTDSNRKFVINEVFSDITENKKIFHNALVISMNLLQPYIDNCKLIHFKYKIYQ